MPQDASIVAFIGKVTRIAGLQALATGLPAGTRLTHSGEFTADALVRPLARAGFTTKGKRREKPGLTAAFNHHIVDRERGI
jgi:hypothetical protein